jgi:hypothetical protein
MGVERLRQSIERWEADRKLAIVVARQDSIMAKAIHKSRWNLRDESDANRAKRPSVAVVKDVQGRSGGLCTGPGGALRTGLI